MEENWKLVRRCLDKKLQERKIGKRQISQERKRLLKSKKELKLLEDAQHIIQSLAKKTQQTTHKKLSVVVSKCLESVFGEEAYEFRFIFETKRSRTEVRPAFFRDGIEYHPTEETGGGCVSIAAMALRRTILALARPQLRQMMFLDEPFTALSPEYQELVTPMLMSLAEKTKMQIILITNNPKFETGKIIKTT